MEKETEVCRVRSHPYLDSSIKEDKEKKERCSRCGGEHFDLSCIYFLRNQTNQSLGNTANS